MVIPSGIESVPPLISNEAPVPTVVPAEPEAPNAVAFCTCITPAVIEVVPA